MDRIQRLFVIDDLEQTDSALFQLVSSGCGSNYLSTATQPQGDGLIPNTGKIGLVAEDGTKWEYIKFSSESRVRLQAQSVLTESEGLTRYAYFKLKCSLSVFELLVDNSMLTMFNNVRKLKPIE